MFGLPPDSGNIFRKGLVIVMPFYFSKKHPKHIYHKYQHPQQKQIPSLNLCNDCISAKSAPQILSITDEYTFLFQIFNNYFV